MYCNAPNYNNPSGCCEGIIDYDAGYNFLYCTKCGVKYKAKELAEAIKENNVIVKSEGDIKMKIVVKKGNEVVKNVVTGEYADLAKSVPAPKVNVNESNEDQEIVFKVSLNKNAPVPNSSDPEIKPTSMFKNVDDMIDSADNMTLGHIVNRATVQSNIKKEVESPISFDTSLKDSSKDVSKEDKFRNLLSDALDIYNTSDVETKDKLVDIYAEVLQQTFDTNSFDEFIRMLAKYYNILRSVNENGCREIIDNVPEEALRNILKCAFDNDIIKSSTFATDDIDYDSSMERITVEFTPTILDSDNEIICEGGNICLAIQPDDLISAFDKAGYYVGVNELLKESEDKSDVNETYSDVKYYGASIINVKDIFQDKKSKKIVTIVDKDGNYLKNDDNDIIAIGTIDNRSIDSISIVPTSWMATAEEAIDAMSESSEDELEENETTVEPTGAFPPVVTVNGVPVEDGE